MAGDWIPAEIGLARKREVLAVAQATGRSRHEVVGLLLDFWGWASCETSNGEIVGATVDALVDAIGGDKHFWTCVSSAGWLAFTAEGIALPNADKWITKGAKARLQKTKRQQVWREKQQAVDDCASTVDVPVDGPASTDASTTEQNRTEEKKDSSACLNFYADEILRAYPKGRRGRPGAAYKAIGEAIRERLEQPGAKIKDVVAYLVGKAGEYAVAVKTADKTYVPMAAKWFAERGYLQDPEEWEKHDTEDGDDGLIPKVVITLESEMERLIARGGKIPDPKPGWEPKEEWEHRAYKLWQQQQQESAQ
jgi:hypothetical protein